MTEKQGVKTKTIKKNLEVIEILNDEKRSKQRSDERKMLKLRIVFYVTRNSNEKQSN